MSSRSGATLQRGRKCRMDREAGLWKAAAWARRQGSATPRTRTALLALTAVALALTACGSRLSDQAIANAAHRPIVHTSALGVTTTTVGTTTGGSTPAASTGAAGSGTTPTGSAGGTSGSGSGGASAGSGGNIDRVERVRGKSGGRHCEPRLHHQPGQRRDVQRRHRGGVLGRSADHGGLAGLHQCARRSQRTSRAHLHRG